MTDPLMQEIVDSSTLRTMSWKNVTFGSLIHLDKTWYLFISDYLMIPIQDDGWDWMSKKMPMNVVNVQCLCDKDNQPISFFKELNDMIVELLNTGITGYLGR